MLIKLVLPIMPHGHGLEQTHVNDIYILVNVPLNLTHFVYHQALITKTLLNVTEMKGTGYDYF